MLIAIVVVVRIVFLVNALTTVNVLFVQIQVFPAVLTVFLRVGAVLQVDVLGKEGIKRQVVTIPIAVPVIIVLL